MYCLCLAGLAGITVTGDAFNVFVFLEISSLSSYVLIALGRDRRALLAAYQYLILGTIGATFIVIGIGLLYLVTGTLNLRDIAARLADVGADAPGARGARVPDRRHLAQGRAVPAAHVAARRLRVRAVGGVGVPRRHGDQGVALRAAAILLLGVRRQLRVRRLPMGDILLVLSLAAMFVASAAALSTSPT